jgi:putative protein kinase ArgK-like GTPase of G3E family
VDRVQLLNKYDEVYEELYKDKELMLRVLLHQFCGVEVLWDVVHTHVTSLHDSGELDDEDLETEVNNVVNAYREVVGEIVEEGLGIKS